LARDQPPAIVSTHLYMAEPVRSTLAIPAVSGSCVRGRLYRGVMGRVARRLSPPLPDRSPPALRVV